jgi:hypothetical protein
MLNRWIAESESNVVPLKSKADEEEENKQKEEKAALKKSEGIWYFRHIFSIKYRVINYLFI